MLLSKATYSAFFKSFFYQYVFRLLPLWLWVCVCSQKAEWLECDKVHKININNFDIYYGRENV